MKSVVVTKENRPRRRLSDDCLMTVQVVLFCTVPVQHYGTLFYDVLHLLTWPTPMMTPEKNELYVALRESGAMTMSMNVQAGCFPLPVVPAHSTRAVVPQWRGL